MARRRRGFGDLNNINLPNSERDIPIDSDGLRVLQDAALKRYKTNVLQGKKEWVGKVLRSWQDPIGGASGKWKNSPFVGKITKCKVNIPELDEAVGKELPCPDDDPNKRGPHQEKINKFKTFEAIDPNLPPPPVGTDVRVMFEDPKNPHSSAGIYLGPVNMGAASVGTVAGPSQAPRRKPAPTAAPTPAPPLPPPPAITPKAVFKKPKPPVTGVKEVGSPVNVRKDAPAPPPLPKSLGLPPKTTVRLKPFKKNKKCLSPGCKGRTSYKEHRVRAMAYKALEKRDSLKEVIPNRLGDRHFKSGVHKLLAVRFKAMNKLFLAEGPAEEEGRDGVTRREPLRIRSGHRLHIYNNDYEGYKETLLAKWKKRKTLPYGKGKKSYVKRIYKGKGEPEKAGKSDPKKSWGRPGKDEQLISDKEILRIATARVAFMSPHETGLAIDLQSHGLIAVTEPGKIKFGGVGMSIKDQEQLPVWKWLHDNAWKFGFTPLKSEPWHWELVVPRENFFSGEEFVTDFDKEFPYAVRVVEVSHEPYPEVVVDRRGRELNTKGKKLWVHHKAFSLVPFA